MPVYIRDSIGCVWQEFSPGLWARAAAVRNAREWQERRLKSNEYRERMAALADVERVPRLMRERCEGKP